VSLLLYISFRNRLFIKTFFFFFYVFFALITLVCWSKKSGFSMRVSKQFKESFFAFILDKGTNSCIENDLSYIILYDMLIKIVFGGHFWRV
jgi:hypothetical protein